MAKYLVPWPEESKYLILEQDYFISILGLILTRLQIVITQSFGKK